VTRRPPEADEAVDKYVEFHRLEPRKIGEFPASFAIPETMFVGGTAKYVTYRSSKVDPESLRKPSRPVDYIHEHDAGVVVYVSDGHRPTASRVVEHVPSEFREVAALTKLGECLGYCFVDEDGVKHEAEGRAPLPELYAVPSGKCLLVIQSKREVIAMIWGGGLGVYARGIDG